MMNDVEDSFSVEYCMSCSTRSVALMLIECPNESDFFAILISLETVTIYQQHCGTINFTNLYMPIKAIVSHKVSSLTTENVFDTGIG